MIKQIITGTFFVIILGSCQSQEVEGTVENKSSQKVDTLNDIAMRFDKGKELFKSHCALCHLAPFAENKPDLRTYFRHLNKDSMDVAASFISFGKKNNSGYLHSYKDSITKEEIQNVIVYCFEASKM